MSQIQTGVLVGGASDGTRHDVLYPDMQELLVERPRPLVTKPISEMTAPTRAKHPFDIYRLANLRCHQDGIEFLFYRHEDMTDAEAFAAIFKHYGEKAK